MSHSFADLRDGLPDMTATEGGILDDHAAERERIESQALGLRDMVLARSKEGIEARGTCGAVLAAMIGDQPQFYFPTWRNDIEKQAVFDKLNHKLQRQGATATVTAFPGAWVQHVSKSATVDDIRNNPHRERVIILITRTAGWKELQIHPFTETDEGIVWAAPTIREDFKSNLVTIPRTN